MTPLSMPLIQWSYQRNILSCSSMKGRDCIGGYGPMSSFFGPFNALKSSIVPSSVQPRPWSICSQTGMSMFGASVIGLRSSYQSPSSSFITMSNQASWFLG